MFSLPKFTIYVLILKMETECCDCDPKKHEKQVKHVEVSNLRDEANFMRQPIQNEQFKKIGDDDYETEDLIEVEQPTNDTTYDSRSNEMKVTNIINSNDEVREDTPNVDFEKTCKFYKDVGTFKQSDMEDVWQIVFYRTAEKLFCFKILIKKLTDKSREILLEDYGDFKGLVNWTNCQFEVISSVGTTMQRHFLQTTTMGRGVYHNIIVRYKKKVGIVLLEQSPDQWLVNKNMLLMRDCDNGHVVIFAKVPKEPSMRDIKEALATFRETSFNGSMACEGLTNPRYQTLS